MSQHSPEPWEIRPLGDGGYHVVAADGETMSPPVYFGAANEGEWRRIVACVSALAGVETEELLQYPPGSIGSFLKKVCEGKVRVSPPPPYQRPKRCPYE